MGFAWREWERWVALHRLTWLGAWCHILPAQPWKEESSVPSCTAEDGWLLLPRCLRSEGVWTSWLGKPAEVAFTDK